MTLSDAIRLGASLDPQVHGSYWGGGQGTCALGAAGRATGYDHSEPLTMHLGRLWPELENPLERECPSCDDPLSRACLWHVRAGLDTLIVHLNDQHRWTRSRIADYLDSLYPDGIEIVGCAQAAPRLAERQECA